MNTERKEIIQLSGPTLVIVMIIIGNMFVLGVMYRWSEYQEYELTKFYARQYSKEIFEFRDIKNEVVRLEGAPNWNATYYVKAHPETRE